MLLETLEKQKFIYKFSQLLSYIRILKIFINCISNENYRILSFQAIKFLAEKKTNYYEIRKMVAF
jgi:hypothetical protein